MSAAAPANAFKLRWLATMRTMPGLTSLDHKVGEWLADNLALGNTVLRTWWELRSALTLSNHEAGVRIGNLARAGLVGQRIRTGAGAGFPLLIPTPKTPASRTVTSCETRADVEERNARRAAARRAADLRADARWKAAK